MVSEALTFILAGGRGRRLQPLTRYRSKPAVPFGGLYRIVDFTISNCINSGLKHIYVLTQYKSHSLERHIRQAFSPYFIHEQNEFISPMPPQHLVGEEWYQGTADAIHQNLHYVEIFEPTYVLILSGDHIYKMDYSEMLHFHAGMDAEVTVAVIEVPTEQARGRLGCVSLGQANRVVGFWEKPEEPPPAPEKSGMCYASMGIYVFDTQVLRQALLEDMANPESSHDFGRDILPLMVAERNVYGYPFLDVNPSGSKYWRDVGTIEAYYEANMDLVSVRPQLNLYEKKWPIYTARTLDPPAKFVLEEDWPGGRRGFAVNSMLCPGCIVSGAEIRGSILGPGVRVEEHSKVEASILMGDVKIGKGVRVRRAIIDKCVEIPDGCTIDPEAMDYPEEYSIAPGGITVIPRWFRTPLSSPRLWPVEPVEGVGVRPNSTGRKAAGQ